MIKKSPDEKMKEIESSLAWASPEQRKWILIRELLFVIYVLLEVLSLKVVILVGIVFLFAVSVDYVRAGQIWFGLPLFAVSLLAAANVASHIFDREDEEEEEE